MVILEGRVYNTAEISYVSPEGISSAIEAAGKS